MMEKIMKNYTLGKRGVIPIIGALFLFFLFFGILLTVLFIKGSIIVVVEYKYGYSNAQLAMLALLSAEHNGKPIQQLIAEKAGNLQGAESLSFLDSKLSDAGITCYKLYTISNPSSPLEEAGTCELKYKAIAPLPLAYNGGSNLVESIVLEIG